MKSHTGIERIQEESKNTKKDTRAFAVELQTVYEGAKQTIKRPCSNCVSRLYTN